MDEVGQLILAPMRGVTGRAFRCAFAKHFSGLDYAVSPFIPTVHGGKIKSSLLDDLRPFPDFPDLPLVPQTIGKDPTDFAIMVRTLLDMGFDSVDLNAGCPWSMVAKKGRGAGLLENADSLRKMLDAGCAIAPGKISIKVRLGMRTNDVLAKRMEIINGYPLKSVTIHPRTAAQMYEGNVDLEAFAECASLCRHPVIYNGDIRSPEDFERLRNRFTNIFAWMTGRGVAGNPFLPEAIHEKTARRDLSRLWAFLDDFTELSKRELQGPVSVLGRLKELWKLLAPNIPNGERLWNSIKLCRTLSEYESVIARH